jgi:hypothetical protein
MSWIEILILLTNGMFALYRWIDIRENRHARQVAQESQKLQRSFNEQITEAVKQLTMRG